MRWPIIAAVLLLVPSVGAATRSATHIDGSAAGELGGTADVAVVLYFVATDCPVSNRTFPEMRRVRAGFAGKPVRFWYVYPNQGESAAAVKQHQHEFDPGGQALLDADGQLARMAHAFVTPSVVVLTRPVRTGRGATWAPVYSGRVDDRYVRLGLERPQITNHFAERVVHEVLAGIPVERPQGNPVGCAIMQPGLTR